MLGLQDTWFGIFNLISFTLSVVINPDSGLFSCPSSHPELLRGRDPYPEDSGRPGGAAKKPAGTEAPAGGL